MLSTVWSWFCTIGQLLFIILLTTAIISAVRDKPFQFYKKFEENHRKLAEWISVILLAWMFIGIAAAMSHVHVAIY